MRLRFLAFLIPGLLAAQSLQDFEKKVTEFTLPNGLTFLIIQRHEAPVVSFHTYVNAGSVDDKSGQTGLAHMFEHMAFKGTPAIGTKNWPEEKKALAAVEVVYDRLDGERNKAYRADPKKIAELQTELKTAIDKANSYVVENAYPAIVEENGGEGLNAGTAEDQTTYFYNFPSNRIELWFLLESERFLHPVFREFYKERDVVREERRMRTESSPTGKLFEQLLDTAFAAHPYKTSPIGWASDIENLREPEAEAYFKQYYRPSNITIGIAGDVDPVQAKKFAEKYFGRLPAGPRPPVVHTVEPEQVGEKRVGVQSSAQPLLLIGYKRPDQYSKDDIPLDVLSDVLSDGRTGILYKDMVRDKKMALDAETGATFPGGKYPSLFAFLVVPASGHTTDENEKEIATLIERVKTQKVDEESLQREKTKLRASLIHQLDSNSGLAQQLAFYQANYGDWRKMFTQIDDYDKVTADDVMRVAKKYLVTEHSTVAYTYIPEKKEAAAK